MHDRGTCSAASDPEQLSDLGSLSTTMLDCERSLLAAAQHDCLSAPPRATLAGSGE